MPTAAILGGGALLGGVAQGAFGYFGAQNAANAQMQAATQALGLQQSEFNTAVNYLSPFATTGNAAYQTLASLYGVGQPGGAPNWQKFLNTPAYQWASQTGNQSLNNTLASQGQILSGNQLTAVMNYNQGLASQQFTNVTNALSSISGMGEQAAGQIGQVASNAAGTMGNTIQNYGAAKAGGIVGGTNAITGAIGSGTSNLLALYGLNKMLGGAGNTNNAATANPSSYQNPWGGAAFNQVGAVNNSGGVPYTGGYSSNTYAPTGWGSSVGYT